MLKRIVPALWLALLLALGVRGVVRSDARYAWGMFPYVLTYEVQYRWRLVDGGARPFRPRDEIKRAAKVYAPGVRHDAWYGVGALREELGAYARMMATSAGARASRPADARAFEIELHWRRDRAKRDVAEVLSAEVAP